MPNLNPPICMKCYIYSDSPTAYSNRWTCEIIVTNGGQTTGDSAIKYTAASIQPGMWIGNGSFGYAFKIITTGSLSSTYGFYDTITCVLEDVDNINAKIDPTQGGEGGGPKRYLDSYIFELVDGLPAMNEVFAPPDITWTDSLVGRFIAYRRGITGPSGATGDIGPTGATGTVGATGPLRKGYYAEFERAIGNLSENTSIILNSTTLIGLDFSIGNSVIIQNLDFQTTHFEGIIQSYDRDVGSIVLEQITNIFGTNYGSPIYMWSINLTGPRGTKFFQDVILPSSGLGRVGDYYIDAETGELYLKK